MKDFARTGLVIAICLLGLALIACLIGIGFRLRTGEDRVGASFSIGKTETRSSLFSSSSSSSSDNAAFNSRHVLFVGENPHPLSRRIATLVAQRLENRRQIDRLEMVKSPAILAEGAEAPDLFLRIDLMKLEGDGVLSRSMKATVAGYLGSAPWQSSYYCEDSTTPPLVQFAWNATVNAETTFSGIRSDRYAEAARSITDEFVKAVSNQLETLSAKFPVLPELPRDFYGPYQPVTDFDFLKEVNARRACSYYDLLTHNQTFWRFQAPTNPVPQLQRITNQLAAAQWKLSSASLTDTENYLVRLRQGDAELEIFHPRGGQISLSPPAKEETSLEFIVHYRQPFSAAEREAALEKLFAERSPIETLLPFQNSFSPAQREKFYALVETTPTASPLACLRLAENYLSRKQTNSAVNLLLRAKALAATANDSAALESSIESLAGEISPQEKLKLEVTPQTCRELGFLEITNAPQTFELERDLGQPLLMFGAGERGLKIYALTIHPPQKGVCSWTLTQAEERSRSTSSSSFDLTGRGYWQQTFTFDRQTVKVTALPLPDKKRVKYTIQTER